MADHHHPHRQGHLDPPPHGLFAAGYSITSQKCQNSMSKAELKLATQILEELEHNL